MNTPQARPPLHVLVKPIGAQCNLRCDYCFYLDKEQLYPGHMGSQFRMTDETLENLVRSVIESRAPEQTEVLFAWQGGEPTLMGLPFFERAIALQQRHTPTDVTVRNTLQTNGTLLTDDFARFLKAHEFLVGISVDGPEHLHNRFRRHTSGRGSFREVMAGIERLNRFGIEYNLMTVVQSDNSQHPEEVYQFLRGVGTPFLQFIPMVEPDPLSLASHRSVSGKDWGRFLSQVFALWRDKDIGRVFVQHFDMLLGIMLGLPASLCVHAKQCGRALAMEHNGDVFSCDHFVDRRHFLGNIQSATLNGMVESPFQTDFGASKSASLPDACKRCNYLSMCHGGCPKDRLIATETGKLNWLCEGYKTFYDTATPYFIAMANALRHKLPATEYARFLPHRHVRPKATGTVGNV